MSGESWVIEKAESLGFEFQVDTHSLSHGLLRYKGCYIMLDCRIGSLKEWQAASACLLAEKVRYFDATLPEGHILRMRSVFFDQYSAHGFRVDYLYDHGKQPLYTKENLETEFEEDLDGQIFIPQVQCIEENFSSDYFDADDNKYYKD